MTAGVTLAMIGFGMYSWTKLAARGVESKRDDSPRNGASYQPIRDLSAHFCRKT